MSAARDRLLSAGLKLFSEKRSKAVSVTELAREANVARSTVYNLAPDMDALFSDVAERVTVEFNKTLTASLDGITDPALRLAFSLAMPLEQFHNDPLAGRFVTEFGLRERRIRKYWFGVPSAALIDGVAEGRFHLRESQIPLFRGQMSGGLLSTMLLIQDGQAGWREAADCFVALQLRALGLCDNDIENLKADFFWSP
ncbi:MAG: TetR/AcrR family transcriptional regulator [Pseudomonadota bacterium]